MSDSKYLRELPTRLHHIFGGRPLPYEALKKRPEKLAELIRTETVKPKAVATSSGSTP